MYVHQESLNNNFNWDCYNVMYLLLIQVASLASATFVCTLGREQQYFLNNQLSASLTPPSWRRCWLAAESLSLLEIPSQELVVSGRYSIVSHKFFACLSESLGVLPYRTKRTYVNMVTSHPSNTHTHTRNFEGSPRTPQNGRKPLFPNQT